MKSGKNIYQAKTANLLDGAADKNLSIIVSYLFMSLFLLSYMWNSSYLFKGYNIQSSGSDAENGEFGRQLLFLFIFLYLVYNIYLRKSLIFLIQIPNYFIPILIWCWLSIFWAIDPGVALRRVGFTTILILSVGYSVQILSYRGILRLLLIGMWGILIADWLAIALFPLAIHQSDELDKSLVGNWRGIHQDKNEAGAFCALCLILTVQEAVRLRSYVSGFFISILAAVFLYETHSKTAGGFVFVALLIGVMAHYGFLNPNLRRMAFWGVLLLTAFGVLWTGDSLTQALIEFIDDPSSLTGRVQIWPVLMDYVSDHLLFGSGFGSFWGIGTKSPIFDYGSGWMTKIYEAHNGYIDLLVQIGAIGFLITVVCLVVRPFYTLFSKPLADGVSRSLICSVLAFGCLHDLLETSLLDRANPIWLIVLTMYCLLSKASARSRTLPRPLPRHVGGVTA